jgi:hypothetical protein
MNQITEGNERVLAPDVDGVVLKLPTSAAIDLAVEIVDAAALKAAGRGSESRERSSIESRTDLRIAATNEAMRIDPNRTESAITVAEHVAKAWADLDTVDYSRIRSASRREFALDAIATHVAASPEYAKELKERSPQLSQAAENINAARAKVEQQLSADQVNIQRQAALNEEGKSRQAAIDAAALASLAALRATESSRVAQALSPTTDRPANGTTTPALEERMKVFDWSYIQSDDAKVFARGNAEFQEITKELESLSKADSVKVTALWNTHAEYHKRPDFLSMEQSRALPTVNDAKPIKRPIHDDELSSAVIDRFIVSHEKRGMWDAGTTEFTYRKGEHQGRLAFVDNGKSLTTPSEDRETIRAMLDVARTKNWKEVTLSGSDDFKRNAWLEARLSGLEVRGYEPREADKLLLQDLLQDRKPQNSITVSDRLLEKPQTPERVATGHAKQVDGDDLSPSAKTIIDNSRAFLMSKDVGEAFTDATMRDLMSKFRTHEGEIIEHGHATYKFDNDNEPSYFVALKTPSGEQVIWGKGLAEVMQERKSGEQVVLQNIGKKDVLVNEKVRDASGHVVASRPKESQLNEWRVELKSRINKTQQTPEGMQPTFRVYDPKAPRIPQPSHRRDMEQATKRSTEIKPPARER